MIFSSVSLYMVFWKLCSCGFHYSADGKDPRRSLNAQIARCTKTHAPSSYLLLPEKPLTMANTLFCILSHKKAHHNDRLLKEQLVGYGVKKQNIFIKYGAQYPEATQNLGHSLASSNIFLKSFSTFLISKLYFDGLGGKCIINRLAYNSERVLCLCGGRMSIGPISELLSPS